MKMTLLASPTNDSNGDVDKALRTSKKRANYADPTMPDAPSFVPFWEAGGRANLRIGRHGHERIVSSTGTGTRSLRAIEFRGGTKKELNFENIFGNITVQ
jgi:hypothetical protein